MRQAPNKPREAPGDFGHWDPGPYLIPLEWVGGVEDWGNDLRTRPLRAQRHGGGSEVTNTGTPSTIQPIEILMKTRAHHLARRETIDHRHGGRKKQYDRRRSQCLYWRRSDFGTVSRYDRRWLTATATIRHSEDIMVYSASPIMLCFKSV